MPGARKLSKIQFGLEGTAGTKVDATQIWWGKGGMPDDDRTIIEPDINVGYLSDVDESYVAALQGSLSMDETEATFEQQPYILACGVEGTVTGAADGAGSGKIYAYEACTTVQKAIKTATLEGGDNEGEEELEYGFVSQFDFSGAFMESMKIQADWMARQTVPGTFTSGLDLPAVEVMKFLNSKLYIDDVDDTIGTTLKSNTFLNMKLGWKTGFIPVFSGDGNLYFSTIKQVAPQLELQITFEHDATSVAEKVAWRAQTSRQIRILTEGSTLASAGTKYSKKSSIIDLAGRWLKFDKLAERNGNDIVTGTFRPKYNATADLFALWTIVNEVAAL